MLDQAKNIGEPYQYLRNVNVRWGKFDLTDVQSMRMTTNEAILFNVQDGDVFVCEGGEPGRCAVWTHGVNDFTYQKALHRVRFGGELNPKLFAWQMLLDARSQKLTDYFTGSTIKHFPKTEIVKYPVLIPPLAEQTRIAEKLDTVLTRVDACRDRLARVAPLLKRFRQSVLAAATSGRLTEDWRRTNAVELPWTTCTTKEAGHIQLGRQRSPKYHSGSNMRPYLRVQNVFEDRLDFSDVMTMVFDAADFERYRLKVGDILLNEGQSPEYLGRPAMYRGELQDACFTNTLIRFQAFDHVHPDFALLVFRHYMHSGRYIKEGTTTTNIAHLGAGRFGEVEFPLPSLDEQKEIDRRAKQLFTFADRLETRLKAAQTAADRLTPALLAKAFRGELVPQDPNDEPAAELLKRLAASRDAAPKAKRGRRSATADATP